MNTTHHGWTVLGDEPPLLLHEYSIGPGNETNTLVAGFGDGELLVVSPCGKPSDELLGGLERFGRVSALLAPNVFHHAGLPAWQLAYPDVAVFASSHQLDKLRRKRKGVVISPVSELLPRLGDSIRVMEPPGTRYGEAWVELNGACRTLYVGDAFTNLATVPWFPMGWLLRPAGIRPGFGVNGARRRWLVTDREEHGDWLDLTLARSPTRLVPGHGDVVEAPDLAAQLKALWRS